MKSAKVILGRVLIGFVLISIGFALGREVTRRSGGPGGDQASTPAAPGGGRDKVTVYYMHSTIRCVTCNAIEARADSILKEQFAAQLGDGSLEWRSVDFQQEEDLARRYDVGVSCLVLVRWRGGSEEAHRRLDEVWAKIGDEDEFARYVSDAVREFLNGGGS